MPTHEHVVSLADDDLLRKMQVAHGTKSVPTRRESGEGNQQHRERAAAHSKQQKSR
jgi:hypothetical protein